MPETSRIVVPVELSERSYNIEVASGTLGDGARQLVDLCDPEHVVVITDSNVGPIYLPSLKQGMAELRIRHDVFTVPAGENSKSIERLNELWEELLQCRTDRSSIVVALGGGVVGDLAGFVAASFGRGLRFFQIPTSLLAQVDSSVGGKVGINLSTAKNMVGAFWQPVGVLVDIAVLETLPDREYQAGLAEVVKYGVIMDSSFFEFLEDHVEELQKREPDVLRIVVARCCELKAQVVCEDERETSGRRAILNYGHTFGHAFEALCGYGTILHGEAVSMGMICASRLAQRMGWIDEQATLRQIELLEKLGLPVSPPELDGLQVLDSMRTDKKTARGKLRFILPRRIGHVELVGEIEDSMVLESIVP